MGHRLGLTTAAQIRDICVCKAPSLSTGLAVPLTGTVCDCVCAQRVIVIALNIVVWFVCA